MFARFRAAADRFFAARKAAFDERDQKFKALADRKRELIAEANAVTDIRRAKQLRDEYKAVGPAGRAEPELFREFNAALDKFFLRAREEFADARTAPRAGRRNLAWQRSLPRSGTGHGDQTGVAEWPAAIRWRGKSAFNSLKPLSRRSQSEQKQRMESPAVVASAAALHPLSAGEAGASARRSSSFCELTSPRSFCRPPWTANAKAAGKNWSANRSPRDGTRTHLRRAGEAGRAGTGTKHPASRSRRNWKPRSWATSQSKPGRSDRPADPHRSAADFLAAGLCRNRNWRRF